MNYLFLFLLIFAINIVPAFMPPTWVILAALYIQFNLLFFPTLILGVVAATTGRVVLAMIAKKWFRLLLPEKFLTNYLYLGNYLKEHQQLTIPVVLGYAFSPVSSNSLFIMAGLSDINLTLIALSFFSGRIITYSFWIFTSHQISHRLEDIFIGHLSNFNTVISTLFSLLIIYLIGKINWRKILKV